MFVVAPLIPGITISSVRIRPVSKFGEDVNLWGKEEVTVSSSERSSWLSRELKSSSLGRTEAGIDRGRDGYLIGAVSRWRVGGRSADIWGVGIRGSGGSLACPWEPSVSEASKNSSSLLPEGEVTPEQKLEAVLGRVVSAGSTGVKIVLMLKLKTTAVIILKTIKLDYHAVVLSGNAQIVQ